MCSAPHAERASRGASRRHPTIPGGSRSRFAVCCSGRARPGHQIIDLAPIYWVVGATNGSVAFVGNAQHYHRTDGVRQRRRQLLCLMWHEGVKPRAPRNEGPLSRSARRGPAMRSLEPTAGGARRRQLHDSWCLGKMQEGSTKSPFRDRSDLTREGGLRWFWVF